MNGSFFARNGWLLGLLLVSCDARPARQAATGAAPPFRLTQPGYSAWRGAPTGSTDSLTIQLVTTGQTSASFPAALATLALPSSEVRQLYERRLSADSLVLEEANLLTGNSEQPAGLWRLRLTGRELAGTYLGQPIRLRQLRSEAVPLAVEVFTDSVRALPSFPGSVSSLAALTALTSTAPPVQQALLRLLANDTTDRAAPPSLAQQWTTYRDQFATDYRAEVDTLRREEGDSIVTTDQLAFEEQRHFSVLWNAGHVLSVTLHYSGYFGGMHGVTSTHFASFDTRTGHRLGFDQLFRPGAGARLQPLVEAAARRQFGLAPTARLQEDGPFLVDRIPVPRNVALTGGGVLFACDPYEIGPYALGEVWLWVPFDQLTELLQPGVAQLPSAR